jgi:hypothetical protein
MSSIRRQESALHEKLETLRGQLWDAQASIDIVAEALLSRFGNWPEGVPDYRRVLEGVSRVIDDVTGDLEPDVLLVEPQADTVAALEVQP